MIEKLPVQTFVFVVVLIFAVIVVGTFTLFNLLIEVPTTTANVNATGALPNSIFYIPIFLALLLIIIEVVIKRKENKEE